MTVQLLADPAAFLAAAGDYLERHAVAANVLATMARRRVDDPGGAAPQDWYAVVPDAAGRVVGAAMRTSPEQGRPMWVGPMPDDAVRRLVGTLHARGERPSGVGGSLPAARTCADLLADRVGGRVVVARRTRLHELVKPVPAPAGPGRLRAVTESDLELATAWYAAFHGDADDQAGRAASPAAAPVRQEMLRRVRSGRTFFWLDEAGVPVHLTGSNPPSLGVARIGPVYTPPEQRGRGWAASAVHAVSSGLRAEGARVVLFTDLDNPTSNALYARLGFEPVVDMADLLVVATDP